MREPLLLNIAVVWRKDVFITREARQRAGISEIAAAPVFACHKIFDRYRPFFALF